MHGRSLIAVDLLKLNTLRSIKTAFLAPKMYNEHLYGSTPQRRITKESVFFLILWADLINN